MQTFISMQMTQSCIVVLLLDNKPLYKLQSAFDISQSRIYNLKLLLNVDETKSSYVVLRLKKKIDKNVSSIQTLQGTLFELVKEYKYLGIIVDDILSFSSHITQLNIKIEN